MFESLRFADSQKQKGPRLRSVLFCFCEWRRGTRAVKARVPDLSGGQSKPWMASKGGIRPPERSRPAHAPPGPLGCLCRTSRAPHRAALSTGERPRDRSHRCSNPSASRTHKSKKDHACARSFFAFVNGGEGGIRTPVTCYRKHAFQACGFSHSPTSPYFVIPSVGNVRE